MFFRLCNSLAMFQGFMNQLFRELINKGHMIIYMDNILVFTEDLEGRRTIVKRVLQVLKDNKLYLKQRNIRLNKKKSNMGLIIGNSMIQMDPGKVDTIKD